MENKLLWFFIATVLLAFTAVLYIWNRGLWNSVFNLTPSNIDSDTEIPNPAAVFCLDCGGIYEIRTNSSDGSQYGVCTIDGVEYDAWDYYNVHFKE